MAVINYNRGRLSSSSLVVFIMATHLVMVLIMCTEMAVGYDDQSSNNKVLLTDVKALTLRRGFKTAARRVEPIDQLHCSYTPDDAALPSTVQCINVGVDDHGDVQWKCEAELDKSLQFDQIEISCEGYDYPNDPYILKGSCGLTYSLKRTPGYHASQHQQQQAYQYQNQYQKHPQQSPGEWEEYARKKYGSHYQGFGGTVKSLFKLAVWGGFFYLILRWCGCFGPARRRPVAAAPGGGAHDGGWREVPPPPPPPYGGGPAGGPAPSAPPPPYAAGYGPDGSTYGAGAGSSTYGYGSGGAAAAPPMGSTAGWRPGFWSGLFGGMALNRFFSGGGAGVRHYPQHYGGGWGGSSWSSGGGANAFRSSGGSSSSSSSSSTTTRTSTGYSSTSRR